MAEMLELENNENDILGIEGNKMIGTCRPLWRPTHLLVMSVIFSPVITMICYILNFHRLGEIKKRNNAIIGYITITAFVIIGVFMLPDVITKLTTIINITCGIFMKQSQDKQFKNHIDNGGKVASLVIPIIASIVVFGFAVFSMIYSENIPTTSAKFYNDEIYYTENITSEEVSKLAEYMAGIGFFGDDENEVAFKFDRIDDTYKISFSVNKEALNDQEIIDTFSSVRNDIEDSIFINQKVVIALTDSRFKELKIISSSDIK